MKLLASLLLFLSIFFLSCSSNQSITTVKQKEPNNTITDLNTDISLADYLKRFSGVMIRGSGSDAVVRVRSGGNSVNSSNEPLFIVNGVEYFGGFSLLSESISTNNIKSVTVLKTASETGIYGMRGANGVIVIKLK